MLKLCPVLVWNICLIFCIIRDKPNVSIQLRLGIKKSNTYFTTKWISISLHSKSLLIFKVKKYTYTLLFRH